MSKKAENAEFARKWVNETMSSNNWNKCIKSSIADTSIYVGDLIDKADESYCKSASGSSKTKISVTADKTYDAILQMYYDNKYDVCVLNFASFFNPGGGFLKGSFAQEESLCAVSGLYSVLSSLDVYKMRAGKDKVPPEYDDELIYSTGVPFTTYAGELSSPYLVDVMSCAAPNCNRIPMTHQDYYIKALRKRIKAIYYLPYVNACDNLILGAWGCGVFKNDPGLISSLFAEVISECPDLYENIVFACGSKDNMQIFKNAMHL